MYMLVSQNHVVVVDPAPSEDAVALLHEIRPGYVDIILTHEHYDHISGVNLLKNRFDCRVICTGECASAISNPKKNLSQYFDILLSMAGIPYPIEVPQAVAPYACSADLAFVDRLSLPFLGRDIELVHTPGHSKGSLCVVFGHTCIFTGDSLLADTPIVTKLPGGSRTDYEKITLPFLSAFPPETHIYPGHGRSGELCNMMLL